MASKFGKDITAPELKLEIGAELEGWRNFIRQFDIAIIGAGMKARHLNHNATNKEKGQAADLELRKAALLHRLGRRSTTW